MNKYAHTTGYMSLGTNASGSCAFALNNPAASGVNLYIRKLFLKSSFIAAVGAASKITFGVGRATGTAAGGTQVAAAAIGRRTPGVADPKATLFKGPTLITGLTADGVGDMMVSTLTHQLTTPQDDLLLSGPETSPGQFGLGIGAIEDFIIAPATSLYVFLRDASIAGVGLSVDIEWFENQ